MAFVGVCQALLRGLLSMRSPQSSGGAHPSAHLPEDLLYPVSSSVRYF